MLYRSLCVITLGLCLQACGQSGALYLPQDKPSATAKIQVSA